MPDDDGVVVALETLSVTVSEAAVDAYEQAFGIACRTVGFFLSDEAQRRWTVEGVKPCGDGEAQLAAALALAEYLTGEAATLRRTPTEAGGWLARTRSAFPEQRVGRRFAIRGTHLAPAATPGRFTIVLDAGVAFGSGEHGSTRGCLRALEQVAHRRPRRVLDLGCGSGILAMAAAKLLHRPVLATDMDPWSVRTAAQNAAANGLRRQVRCRLASGWRGGARAGAPYDLVFANILARPLCAMAAELSANLAPGGTAILAGLLSWQVRLVLVAHRRAGLLLEAQIREADWATLVLRKPDGRRGCVSPSANAPG